MVDRLKTNLSGDETAEIHVDILHVRHSQKRQPCLNCRQHVTMTSKWVISSFRFTTWKLDLHLSQAMSVKLLYFQKTPVQKQATTLIEHSADLWQITTSAFLISKIIIYLQFEDGQSDHNSYTTVSPQATRSASPGSQAVMRATPSPVPSWYNSW